MNTTTTTDPTWESTQMDHLTTEEKKRSAIIYALQRIHAVPHIAWYCGVGTQLWSLLTEALAADQGKPVREIRLTWKPERAVNPENQEGSAIPSVLASPKFFARMNRELRVNASKGNWSTWKPDRMTCMDELHHHLRKLGRAIRLNDKDRVAEFCADLANIAMKTAEVHGTEGKE